MPSGTTKRIPWWRQEVAGSKRQIFARQFLAEALSYVLIGVVYGIFRFGAWVLVIAVPSILIALIIHLRPPKAPLSILSNPPDRRQSTLNSESKR